MLDEDNGSTIDESLDAMVLRLESSQADDEGGPDREDGCKLEDRDGWAIDDPTDDTPEDIVLHLVYRRGWCQIALAGLVDDEDNGK